MKYVIKVSDVPRFTTIFNYIRYKTDIVKKFNRLPKQDSHVYELDFGMDVAELKRKAESAINKHGTYGWLSKQGRSKSSYRSLSLVHNPHIDDPEVNEYNSTLGSSLIGNQRFFYTTWFTVLCQLRGKTKNSYYDSFAFNQPNSIMTEEFADLLSTFQRTQIRSRMSVILANASDSLHPEYLLHKDEHVYHNVRINIPLTDTSDHFLKIEDQEVCFEAGKAYTWDTHKPHRVYGMSTQPRINLVLGFSPWFDYVQEDDVWISNQYYGEVHPLEMVRTGLVSTAVAR